MPTNLTALRVFVASPGDVPAERDALEQIAAEVNRDTARPNGLHLDLWKWEIDACPGFHVSGPQGWIDEAAKIDQCDLLIGIFWKRLGSLTPDGRTGAEHEIHVAYEAWTKRNEPALMIYFNQHPHNASSDDELDQIRRLRQFRER